MDKKQPIDYGQEIGISISIATPLKCKVVWSVLSLMLYFYFIKYFHQYNIMYFSFIIIPQITIQ